jgi:hypothetical protein
MVCVFVWFCPEGAFANRLSIDPLESFRALKHFRQIADFRTPPAIGGHNDMPSSARR